MKTKLKATPAPETETPTVVTSIMARCEALEAEAKKQAVLAETTDPELLDARTKLAPHMAAARAILPDLQWHVAETAPALASARKLAENPRLDPNHKFRLDGLANEADGSPWITQVQETLRQAEQAIAAAPKVKGVLGGQVEVLCRDFKSVPTCLADLRQKRERLDAYIQGLKLLASEWSPSVTPPDPSRGHPGDAEHTAITDFPVFRR